MSEAWARKPFIDCLDKSPKTSKIPKKRFQDRGQYPIVSQEKDLINGYWDNPDDVVRVDHPVIVFGDHTQAVKLIDFDFVVGADGVKILKPKPFLDPRYFYYFLIGHPVKALGYARHFRLLKKLEVAIPSLAEQKRIVAILDETFAGIETAIANSEKNLAHSREIFRSHLRQVFSCRVGRWTESTVRGLIDTGVIAKPIDGNHGEVHPKKADFQKSGVPFIMAADLVKGQVNQTTCHFISDHQAEKLRKGFAVDGDVLLSHKGTIGRSAVLKTEHDYVMLTPQVTYYRVMDRGTLINRFLFYCFQSPFFLQEFSRIAGAGSTRAYIGITRQQDLHISFPVSLEQQRAYVESFDALKVETSKLEMIYSQKLAALEELKESLLQKAFTGELTAAGVEREVETATA